MLTSSLLRSDTKLQACATGPAFHITRGASGAHVSRLQLALLLLGHDGIERGEWRCASYGPSTAATVLAYKRSRDIVNRSYQQQADDIVGVMTVQRLDAELSAIEALARGAAAPRTRGRMSDSALSFELRRNVALLRKHARGGTDWSFGAAPGGPLRLDKKVGVVVSEMLQVIKVVAETADHFSRMVQEALSAHGSGRNNMVFPAPNGDRARICKIAEAETVGQRFDQIPGIWKVVHPTAEAPKPIDRQWCGIYAATVINKGHLFDLSWKSAIAKGETKLPYSTDLRMLAPGDVLIDGTMKWMQWEGKMVLMSPNHHMLILSISADRLFADILEGNTGDGSAAENKNQFTRSYHLPVLPGNFSFISVDTMRDRSVSYPYRFG